MDDLLQEFIAETRETADALAGEIVAWEAAPGDRARLDAIFRFVHTVKGSCGFLDLPRLERLAHSAEDALAAVRDGERRPDRALVDAVLAIVDRIGEIVDALESGASLDDVGEELLIAALMPEAVQKDAPVEIAPVAAGPAMARAPMRSVRLSVDLLDRMMSGMSDMVLARNELARRLRNNAVDPAAEAALERLSATVADMRETVTRTRMQKIDALFSPLPRLVRDTAAGLGKQVRLEIEGGDVELDREMIEVMRDPLVHIIRNSIDHGIERPAERRIGKKPEAGLLTVAARQAGNQIVIEVTDDGRGIDIDRVVAKLIATGRDANALRKLSDREKMALIFEPGLTTKDQVSSVSGRGVGMDVVRAAIDGIGGRIELDSVAGRGLRISIHVPLTLSILSTIIIRLGEQRFAIPRGVIEEIVSVRGQGVRIDEIGDRRVATVRERRLPVVALGTMLGVSAVDAAMLVIVNIGIGSFVVGVDEVLDHEELVIKPAAPAVMLAGVYAGQSLPDSGRPMLLIDCAGVANRAGLSFRVEKVEEETVVAADPGVPVLTFRDLDGAQRAVPLSIVDRIETASADQVHHAGGRVQLTLEGELVPLAMLASLPDGGFSILRLRDGAAEIAYAIAQPDDIVAIAPELTPPIQPGPIAGVALVEGQPVEVLDAHWLFARHSHAQNVERDPVCLLDERGNNWMTVFLGPLLRSAGYRVASRIVEGDRADVVIRLDSAAEPILPDGAPVVRLVTDPCAADGEDTIYRYDRERLLAAVGASVGRGR